MRAGNVPKPGLPCYGDCSGGHIPCCKADVPLLAAGVLTFLFWTRIFPDIELVSDQVMEDKNADTDYL